MCTTIISIPSVNPASVQSPSGVQERDHSHLSTVKESTVTEYGDHLRIVRFSIVIMEL